MAKSAAKEVTEIDGSVLEGGGQILRLSITLSSLLKKPIKISRIRAGRSKAGLRPQHLKGIEIAREMCKGNLAGANIDSTEIVFHPGVIKSGVFEADTKTAGSVGLLLQIALPIALFSPSHTVLKLKGGTNAEMAPPIDHSVNVLIPILKKLGATCDCSIVRRGFYPKGGGEIEVKINPIKSLLPLNMTLFGVITRIWGKAFVAGVLPFKIANEMAEAAEALLNEKLPKTATINIQRVKETPTNSYGNGSGIVLFVETDTGCVLGASALCSKGMLPEAVGSKAANELISVVKLESCVDQYTQDQVIIFMALAKGKSVVKCGPITEHTKTAIHIAETLTNSKFTLNKTGSDTNFLECEGIGFENTLIL